jgi:hypothetical protein
MIDTLKKGIQNSTKMYILLNPFNLSSFKLLSWLPGFNAIKSNDTVPLLQDLSKSVIKNIQNSNGVNSKRKSAFPVHEDAKEFQKPKKLNTPFHKIDFSCPNSETHRNSYSKFESKLSLSGDEMLVPQSDEDIQDEFPKKSLDFSDSGVSTSANGSVIYGQIDEDIPVRIVGHTLKDLVPANSGKLRHLYFKVEWRRRKDGTRPEDSFYSYNILKKKASLQILDYIENKLELYE